MVDYVVRSLREEELDGWLDHVAYCFEAKGTPRSHFYHHYHKDPWKRVDGIIIALAADGDDSIGENGTRIAGTLRVFDRRCYIGGRECRLGGIGEVCTKPEHRRKGLCRRLLAESGRLMASWGLDLSALHSSEMADVYLSSGYQSVPLHYTIAAFSSDEYNAAISAACTSRMGMDDVRVCAVVHGDKDVDEDMMRAYGEYNSRFNGAIARDTLAYWQDYLPTNVGCGGHCLRGPEGGFRALLSLAGDKKVKGRYRVVDFFCCDSEYQRDGGAYAFMCLLPHQLAQMPDLNFDSGDLLLKLPKPLADSTPSIDWGHTRMGQVAEEVDGGQMYRPLSDDSAELLRLLGSGDKHMIWAADGY